MPPPIRGGGIIKLAVILSNVTQHCAPIAARTNDNSSDLYNSQDQIVEWKSHAVLELTGESEFEPSVVDSSQFCVHIHGSGGRKPSRFPSDLPYFGDYCIKSYKLTSM